MENWSNDWQACQKLDLENEGIMIGWYAGAGAGDIWIRTNGD